MWRPKSLTAPSSHKPCRIFHELWSDFILKEKAKFLIHTNPGAGCFRKPPRPAALSNGKAAGGDSGYSPSRGPAPRNTCHKGHTALKIMAKPIQKQKYFAVPSASQPRGVPGRAVMPESWRWQEPQLAAAKPEATFPCSSSRHPNARGGSDAVSPQLEKSLKTAAKDG